MSFASSDTLNGHTPLLLTGRSVDARRTETKRWMRTLAAAAAAEAARAYGTPRNDADDSEP
jgi:hypothetical protein